MTYQDLLKPKRQQGPLRQSTEKKKCPSVHQAIAHWQVTRFCMYILTPKTNKECTFDTFFTVTTARKASTYDIVQLGCGARRSP